MTSSKLLSVNENSIYFSTSLAINIGVKESMVLSEIIRAKEKENTFYFNLNSIMSSRLPFIDESTLKRIIKKLASLGLIKRVYSDKNLILATLNSKPPYLGVGNKICSACGCTTSQLHEHHYPIRKSEGGTQTISLCPNCHFEYHYMEFNYEINYELISLTINKLNK